jgi:hypothetical protein
VKLYAVPHFQVEGMDVNLSLVSQMPKEIVIRREANENGTTVMGQGHDGFSPAFSATGRVCGLVCRRYCPMGLSSPGGDKCHLRTGNTQLGRLQARHLHRFPDGTLIDTDNADALPPVLSLDGGSQEVTWCWRFRYCGRMAATA